MLTRPRAVRPKTLSSARLAVSPFGWGEVTDRDFEIVIRGARLVKPDMFHLETEPDIYRDGETYAAVRWDMADLADHCPYFLDHPTEAEAIAQHAHETYRRWIEEHRFVASIRKILERIESAA